MNLNDLNINDKAYIKNVRHSGIKKRRLYDLGFIDGEIVEKKFTSLFKDPSCYKIKNAFIALRDKDASKIEVSYEWEYTFMWKS